MPKLPTRTAIDAAVAAGMATDLTSRTFRKKQLTWSLDEPERSLAVEVESSRRNTGNHGMWRLNFLWSVPNPGASNGVSGRTNLGVVRGHTVPSWDWACNLSQPHGVSDLTAQVTRDWTDYGSPFIDACVDAPSVVRFLADHVTGQVEAAGTLVGHAMQCRDDQLIVQTLEGLRSVYERNEREHADTWTRADRFRGFWGFLPAIGVTKLTTQSRLALERLIEGLDRPQDEKAAGWYDIVATAAQLADDH